MLLSPSFALEFHRGFVFFQGLFKLNYAGFLPSGTETWQRLQTVLYLSRLYLFNRSHSYHKQQDSTWNVSMIWLKVWGTFGPHTSSLLLVLGPLGHLDLVLHHVKVNLAGTVHHDSSWIWIFVTDSQTDRHTCNRQTDRQTFGWIAGTLVVGCRLAIPP